MADVEGEPKGLVLGRGAQPVSDVTVVGTNGQSGVHLLGEPDGDVSGNVADFGDGGVSLDQNSDGVRVILVVLFPAQHGGDTAVMGLGIFLDVPKLALALLEGHTGSFHSHLSESNVSIHSNSFPFYTYIC